MSQRLLVVGASGAVGSATVQAALRKSIPTVAFLRTPSKLPADLATSPLLEIKTGDARSAADVRSALTSDPSRPITAVVLAAPFGSMRQRGTTGYEEIAKNTVGAVQEQQKQTGRKIKLWIMAGSAVLSHPDNRDRYLSSYMPVSFYVEYGFLIDWLKENATDVDWSMNCPALIKQGKALAPYYDAIDILPGYQRPFFFTPYLPLGTAVNIFYNWVKGYVTFDTLGTYMVDHLEADGRLKGKRVGVLERT